ncbi:pappalysin-2 [Hoplias malabaricus]|uniref:pappalysin-2 n=1 Tax=Hoplias malabaricus TaxID=27720 RepID=UPI0034630839
MFLRLLAVLLILFHTWLLNPAKSDHIQRYKRSLAQRADRSQAALGQEQCGSVSQRRPPRSASQHHQIATVAGRYSRLSDLHHRVARSSCLGGCSPDESHALELREGSLWERKSEKWTMERRSDLRTDKMPDSSGHSWDELSVDANETLENDLTIRRDSWTEKLDREHRDIFVSARRAPRSPRQAKDHSSKVASKQDVHSPERTEDNSGEREGPNMELWGTVVRDIPLKWMTALYFSGKKEQLKVNPAVAMELPSSRFTLELWVKPDGGQHNPAIIAGVFDNCSHAHSERGWSVGIQTVEPTRRKDARFYFSLRTDRALKSTTLTGHQHYKPLLWTHVVARYDGHLMSLFIDGSKVAESRQQSGDLYSQFMKSCRVLLLGGSRSNEGHGFRGYLGGVILWNHARAQEELFKSTVKLSEHQRPLLALWADFSDVKQQWMPYKDRHHPTIVALPAPEQETVSPFLPPPCGVTACDNPDVVLSYHQNWQLRAGKRLRYRVVNICADDGSNPTVSQQQIQQQHLALEEAFQPYNLSLELSVFTVCNSSIQRRFILSNCHVAKVGNRHCDRECDHPLTGYDGGDCLRLGTCYNWMRGDGVCNPECNSIHYDYDDGDCCDPKVTEVTKTCFDPESPERAYLSVKELKELLHLSSSDTLNVFFATNSAREELAGAATWPWAKEALTHQGGMILNPSYFGTVGHNNTMIHEMGHIFGLYHVFKGVSERESCDDPCQETTASMETGDFCADTAPTPKFKACRDPDPINDTCGLNHYHDTPYNNYMSYTDDNCTDHFTPHQVARMHCYIDLVYQNWVLDRRPTPVPLAPMVVGQSHDSVSIHWLHPISGPLMQREEGVNCQLCDEHGVLRQYAFEASSPHTCDSSGYWTPEEAVGAPDVYQPCEPSMRSWSPEFSLYEANMTSPCPQTEGCVLQLYFQHPVVPDTLTVWITYISSNIQAVSNLELILESGESVHTGPQQVFCDVPLTLRVNTEKKVKAIKICTFDKKLEIDAVLLTSRPRVSLCSGCRPMVYRVSREPPIREDWGPVVLKETTYTDSDVQKGRTYSYQIQVEADGLLSELSPALIYTHGEPYCGDSRIQRNEQCDDGNLLDGDGCSKKCRMEPGFNCVGQPSQCYIFEGDGVCEEFERRSSVRDCGFFTPEGFIDQWAFSASASHQDQRCPAQAATGLPDLTEMCRSQYVEVNDALMRDAWIPCTAQSGLSTLPGDSPPVWLRVGFKRPGVAASVLIYLAYDGGLQGENCRRTVSVQLCDTGGKTHALGTYELSCQRNPLVVNVTHNLSLPFFQTSAVLLEFSTVHVAVLGVALRTSCHFSAFALTGCVKTCSVEPCSALKVDHALVNCTQSPHPTRCSVSCHRGHTLRVLSGQGVSHLQKEIELSCKNGLWNHEVSCQPVDCGLPNESHVYFASFSCPWGTTFGKQCTFSCNTPSILKGESDTLACLEDGLWSFPEAYCKIECLDPPVIPSAKLLTPQCEGSRHDVGTVCRYKCNPGYSVTSLSTKIRKRFLRLECVEGGRWQQGACSPVSCPVLPAMFEGMYKCTNHLHFDSVCTLHCPDPSEKYTIRCTKDGRWTEDFSMCKKMEGTCQAPAELHSVEYTCDDGHGVGAVCYPTCVAPLSDPVLLANNFTAETLKHWVLPTKVQSIVCTGTMKWHPNPEQIHCIQSCEPFDGDGWCDTINNRAYCQYDGGDCCPSTLSTRKVIQFGVDCDQDECTCRDPEAEENKGRAERIKRVP